MGRTQRGVSLTGALAGMIGLALGAVVLMMVLPAYLDYWAVEKIAKAMVESGEIRGTVAEIRKAFDRRNAVENVTAVSGADLDISKEGGETVVAATWSSKVNLAGNVSVCLDFSVSTAK